MLNDTSLFYMLAPFLFAQCPCHRHHHRHRCHHYHVLHLQKGNIFFVHNDLIIAIIAIIAIIYIIINVIIIISSISSSSSSISIYMWASLSLL